MIEKHTNPENARNLRWPTREAESPRKTAPPFFEKFRQRDNSETREFVGLGLGLFIAKRFAHLMDGVLLWRVESGRGSTLTVILPIASDHGHPATDSNTRQLAAARWNSPEIRVQVVD